MIKFIEYIQEKILKAKEFLIYLSETKEFSSNVEQEELIKCKLDLEKAYNTLDFLKEIHSNGSIDFYKFAERYYKFMVNNKDVNQCIPSDNLEVEQLLSQVFSQYN